MPEKTLRPSSGRHDAVKKDKAAKTAKTPPAAKQSGSKGASSKNEYDPADLDTWFLVLVDTWWKDQHGFKLFEVSGEPEDDGSIIAREWRCAAELEPPGGFKFGHQKFKQGSKKLKRKARLLREPKQAYVEVSVRRMTHGKGGSFVEIEFEQERVSEAYTRLALRSVLGKMS
ncbi:hypothetical protein T484DRAFT_1908793 [Baffinella frigidus]|nr:hypothetical protein T484DRAFT_1908793 [Cryptophyta sp. CCMP2293]